MTCVQEDSRYAKVGFNTIMYYVQLGVPSALWQMHRSHV